MKSLLNMKCDLYITKQPCGVHPAGLIHLPSNWVRKCSILWPIMAKYGQRNISYLLINTHKDWFCILYYLYSVSSASSHCVSPNIKDWLCSSNHPTDKSTNSNSDPVGDHEDNGYRDDHQSLSKCSNYELSSKRIIVIMNLSWNSLKECLLMSSSLKFISAAKSIRSHKWVNSSSASPQIKKFENPVMILKSWTNMILMSICQPSLQELRRGWKFCVFSGSKNRERQWKMKEMAKGGKGGEYLVFLPLYINPLEAELCIWCAAGFFEKFCKSAKSSFFLPVDQMPWKEERWQVTMIMIMPMMMITMIRMRYFKHSVLFK